MKRKEILNLAKKIAQQELILQNSTNTHEKSQAEIEIMRLCSSVHSVEDMLAIDDIVLEILKNNS